MIGESRSRGDRLAIDPVFAQNGAFVRRPLDPGAERGEPKRSLDLGGDRPGAVALAEGDLVERGAAQPAAGRQEGNRLDQIGLAGAIGADQHDGRRVGFKRRRVIIAEVGEPDLAKASGNHEDRM